MNELGKLIPLNVRCVDEAKARKLMKRTVRKKDVGTVDKCQRGEIKERLDAKTKCKQDHDRGTHDTHDAIIYGFVDTCVRWQCKRHRHLIFIAKVNNTGT